MRPTECQGSTKRTVDYFWVSFAPSDILLLTTTAPVIATPSKLALVSKDGERASGPHFTMKRREGGSRERPTFELRSDSEAQS